jgi:hypothetical protein
MESSTAQKLAMTAVVVTLIFVGGPLLTALYLLLVKAARGRRT